MNLNYDESGRSMVEMLGVLAITGVLSVGGIAGYTAAMNKHRANELLSEASKRATTVAIQAAQGKTTFSLREFGNAQVVGSTLDVIPVGNTRFGITVSEMDKSVCQNVLNSIGNNTPIRYLALMASPETPISECGNDGTAYALVYNNDLTADDTSFNDANACSGDGRKCASGKYYTCDNGVWVEHEAPSGTTCDGDEEGCTGDVAERCDGVYQVCSSGRWVDATIEGCKYCNGNTLTNIEGGSGSGCHNGHYYDYCDWNSSGYVWDNPNYAPSGKLCIGDALVTIDCSSGLPMYTLHGQKAKAPGCAYCDGNTVVDGDLIGWACRDGSFVVCYGDGTWNSNSHVGHDADKTCVGDTLVPKTSLYCSNGTPMYDIAGVPTKGSDCVYCNGNTIADAYNGGCHDGIYYENCYPAGPGYWEGQTTPPAGKFCSGDALLNKCSDPTPPDALGPCERCIGGTFKDFRSECDCRGGLFMQCGRVQYQGGDVEESWYETSACTLPAGKKCVGDALVDA